MQPRPRSGLSSSEESITSSLMAGTTPGASSLSMLSDVTLLSSPEPLDDEGAPDFKSAGGTRRNLSFSEKHMRHCGVIAVSGTKTPTPMNLAKGVEQSGAPHSHDRHTDFFPSLHKWVLPLFRLETCRPMSKSATFLTPTLPTLGCLTAEGGTIGGGDAGGGSGFEVGGGRATHPPSTKVHPLLIAEQIAFFAVSSVTQAAESYMRGMADPTDQ